MNTTNQFYIDLHQELLEEASFLYELRSTSLCDHESTWLKIGDYEERFEAQIKALLIGGQLALDYCIKQAKEGDFGELHAAVRVFCRQDRQDLVNEVIDELDLGDDKRVNAVTDALCYELPESWRDDFLHTLFEKGPEFSMIAARITGYLRLDFSSYLFDILRYHKLEKKVLLCLFNALGRIRPRLGTEVFLSFLHSQDRDIIDAAITVLIRIGEHQALTECMAYIGPGDWPKLSLGLYGGRDSLSDIFFSVSDLNDEENSTYKDDVLAAGLIGNIEAIPGLVESLSSEGLAENAALALNLLTGAELYEDHFIPEEIDEDTLFEDELEKFRKGELYLPGEEPGVTTTRLSQNRNDWVVWWNEHQERFDPEIRYRNGKPYSPECLLDNIRSGKSPDVIRKLAYEELVIRYGIDIPFESDMPVHQQLYAIEQYMIRLKGNPDGFEEGKWYVHGALDEQKQMELETV